MLKQSTVILKMAKARQYYTEFERSLLRELVSKQLHVVENKKTDFASIKKKSDVWVNLAKKFNAEIGVQERNDKQLKKCWDNMKTRAKNDKTKERRERLQTGGGQVSASADDESQKVSAMVATQINPLKNPYDGDAATDDDQHTEEESDDAQPTAKPEQVGTTVSPPVVVQSLSTKRAPSMTAAQKVVISRQEEEHLLRMEILKAQLRHESEEHGMKMEEHKLKMEILSLKKKKLLNESNTKDMNQHNTMQLNAPVQASRYPFQNGTSGKNAYWTRPPSDCCNLRVFYTFEHFPRLVVLAELP